MDALLCMIGALNINKSVHHSKTNSQLLNIIRAIYVRMVHPEAESSAPKYDIWCTINVQFVHQQHNNCVYLVHHSCKCNIASEHCRGQYSTCHWVYKLVHVCTNLSISEQQNIYSGVSALHTVTKPLVHYNIQLVN